MDARIVDVGGKRLSRRRAVATGAILLSRATIEAIRAGKIEKGDVLTVAKVAALAAVKKTPDLLPLCHPLAITRADVAFALEADRVQCTVTVEAEERTGVEMEALCGAAAGLLCVWDMTKALEKDERGQYPTTRIVDLRVASKEKGLSVGG
ncbi:MAG: cyclic pyranopterin monophosphate synthase MoaC [Methanobacteriota archaeon]